MQGIDSNRGDFDDHEIEDPIRRSSQRGTFIPHTQTIDFCREEPWYTLEANAEEDVVQKEERHRRGSKLLLRDDIALFLAKLGES